MTIHVDDTGAQVRLATAPRRIVSLVPSLTEAIAASAPETLAGVTDWCSHPIDLDAVRVGGTKNPDVASIISLAPDLVIANAEENRADDVDALRSAGQQVWVTDIRTVEQALTSMARLLEAIDAPSCSWLDDARSRWDGLPEPPAAERRRAVITIWRRPWMHVGSDTYAGDVLRLQLMRLHQGKQRIGRRMGMAARCVKLERSFGRGPALAELVGQTFHIRIGRHARRHALLAFEYLARTGEAVTREVSRH